MVLSLVAVVGYQGGAGSWLEARHLPFWLYATTAVTLGAAIGAAFGAWGSEHPEEVVPAGATVGALVYGGATLYLGAGVFLGIIYSLVGAVAGGFFAHNALRDARDAE